MIVVFVIAVILVGLIAFALGGFMAVTYFKKQLRENPPINESQIRDLYKKLGRKPSEKQIKQIISSFKQNT